MPSAPKLFISGTTISVSFRTKEGLPFVPVSFINEIIWSNLAKAQSKYPVKIIWITFEANHAHMLLRVTNPELISAFVGYVKQETSHALNRLLDRKK